MQRLPLEATKLVKIIDNEHKIVKFNFSREFTRFLSLDPFQFTISIVHVNSRRWQTTGKEIAH